MSLDNALQELIYEQGLKEQAEQARRDGRISEAEYAYFLQKELGIEATPKPPIAERRKSVATKATVVMILMFGILGGLSLFMGGGDGLTGYITYTQQESVLPVELLFTEDGSYALNMTNITGLSVSGTGTGTGRIILMNGADELLVHEYLVEEERYKVLTEKESYALNETVNVTLLPENVSSTLWLIDENGERTLMTLPYLTTMPGAYSLDALINDSGRITKASTSFLVRNDTNVTRDILREAAAAASVTFTEACDESCSFISGDNLSLRIETTGEVRITAIITTNEAPNEAPIQLYDLDAVRLAVGDSATIDLDEYFLDGNGETLTYDFMNVDNAEMSVAGSLLTITGIKAGERQSIIYASDLNELIQSNPFTITVTGETTSDNTTPQETTPTASNETGGATTTGNATDATTNETGNTTLAAIPPGLCNHPDPNKRPIECLQEDPAQYFQAQTIYLTDTGRNPIARITPIGNLLITGEVITQANFQARPSDYVIGYEDAYGNFQATIWFDSETGNVYLKGNLHEENENNVPLAGSFTIKNKRGITLAWADKTNGELYLRGNVIPERGSIE